MKYQRGRSRAQRTRYDSVGRQLVGFSMAVVSAFAAKEKGTPLPNFKEESYRIEGEVGGVQPIFTVQV